MNHDAPISSNVIPQASRPYHRTLSAFSSESEHGLTESCAGISDVLRDGPVARRTRGNVAVLEASGGTA